MITKPRTREGARLWCTRCIRQLPRDMFKIKPDGRTFSWCIPCKRAYDAVAVASKRAAQRGSRTGGGRE